MTFQYESSGNESAITVIIEAPSVFDEFSLNTLYFHMRVTIKMRHS